MNIAGREIGPEQPPYIVAEIGSNHDGRLERALGLIAIAARSGANAVKFQHWTPRKFVSFEETNEDTLALIQSLAIPPEWTLLLAECAKNAGVAFISTPFDLERADEIETYVDAYKISSGDITYHDLIRHVASKNKPLLLATGAANEEDVDAAIGAYLNGTADREPPEYGQDLVLLQCNADYSGNMEGLRHQNLRVLRYWADTYYSLRGISDHTPGHVAACAAVALGGCVVEKHLTDDRSRSGPDHSFAMEPDDFRKMVSACRWTWEALGDGAKKVEANEEQTVMRRALRWFSTLPEGHIVDADDLDVTRPCPPEALAPYHTSEVVGRSLRRLVERDTLVRLEDLE